MVLWVLVNYEIDSLIALPYMPNSLETLNSNLALSFHLGMSFFFLSFLPPFISSTLLLPEAWNLTVHLFVIQGENCRGTKYLIAVLLGISSQ